MPQLTDQQIAQFASNAGFTGPDLETAIAVALAESRGNSDAIGDVALQTDVFGPSVGLWQIRSVNPGYGNQFDQTHRNHQANLDPATNAQNAHAIFDRYGWGQWSTHTNGDYRQFLDRARGAIGDQHGATTTPNQNVAANQGAGGSNPQGFMTELTKLIEAIGKLANPADKLGKVAQAAGQAVARSGAFSNVPGAQAAAQGHQAAASRHAAAAKKAGAVTRALGAEIKGSHDAKAMQAGDQATDIDTTVNRPGYLDLPAIPGNVA